MPVMEVMFYQQWPYLVSGHTTPMVDGNPGNTFLIKEVSLCEGVLIGRGSTLKLYYYKNAKNQFHYKPVFMVKSDAFDIELSTCMYIALQGWKSSVQALHLVCV